jgi:hypothetical protein
MTQQWFTANFVQHLGMSGLEPRTLSSGHDGDGETMTVLH